MDRITLTYRQAFAQSNFFGLSIQSKSNTKMWFKIQIQIHFPKWIDNPIQIQSQSNYLRKKWKAANIKSILHKCFWHGIPKRHIFINQLIKCKINVDKK